MTPTAISRWIPRAIGGAVAVAAVGASFTPSLMPRSKSDQAIVSTLSAAAAGTAAWGAASLGAWMIDGVRGVGWIRPSTTRTALILGGVAAAALGVGTLLSKWGHDAVVGSGKPPEPGLDPADVLDGAGKRFLGERTTGLAHEPIRVFAGLQLGRTIDDRVQWAVDELERQGAFDRDRIIIASPTGSGYVEPVLLEAVERLADGDVATVTIQSNDLPSALSVPKIPVAAESHERLVRAVASRIAELHPDGSGPKLYVTGISHGAWSSSDVFADGPGRRMRELGVDGALWVGMPGLAQFATRGLDEGPLPAGVVAYSNADDPVRRFSLDTFYRRPDWLGPSGSRPAGVSEDQRWFPIVSGIQTMIDLKNATAPAPATGEFETRGHEYRGKLLELSRDAFGFDVSDERYARIEAQLQASSRARATG